MNAELLHKLENIHASSVDILQHLRTGNIFGLNCEFVVIRRELTGLIESLPRDENGTLLMRSGKSFYRLAAFESDLSRLIEQKPLPNAPLQASDEEQLEATALRMMSWSLNLTTILSNTGVRNQRPRAHQSGPREAPLAQADQAGKADSCTTEPASRLEW